MKVKKAICWFCYNSCHLLVHDEDGHVVEVTGDPDTWQSGFICERGTAAPEVHHHPKRLNYPLKRAGERGEGKWQRISWDQALDEIATKLKEIKEKYGAEAVANTRGSWKPGYPFMGRFYHLFGSPNYFGPGHICYNNESAIGTATYGGHVAPHLYGGTNCIVLWGRNLPQSHPNYWPIVEKAKQRGAKVIAIDPRRSDIVEAADIWLQIRPGTDGALALAWLNVIIEEFLYDKEFVEKWTVGFDKLAERVKEYPPEKVAKITGIPAEKIKETARIYAMTKPACIISGVKFDHLGRNATQAYRAICILRAITGNLNVPGGEMVGGSGSSLKIVSDTGLELGEKLPPEQRKKQLGADRFRLMSWPAYEIMEKAAKECPSVQIDNPTDLCAAHAPIVWRTIVSGKPYPVKALTILANNPLVEHTNSKLVYQALKKLDLIVVYDLFMTPTAALADYVLPAADWLERPELMPTIQYNSVNAEERAVQPLYERRDDYQLWRGLGVRLGQEKYWPWKTSEEVCDYRVKRLGCTFKEFVEKGHEGESEEGVEFKNYEKYGFGTPSKKVELYSSIFKKLGYDPLPNYEEPAESPVSTPELAKEYPLIFINGGKTRLFTHSQFRQVKSLRKKNVDPIVQIHPDTAKELGIADGDWVYIETRLGKIKQKAKLFPGIGRNVIHAQHGWWFPEKPEAEPSLFGVWESNTSLLIDDDPDVCDPICGSWPYIGLCNVYKAEEA